MGDAMTGATRQPAQCPFCRSDARALEAWPPVWFCNGCGRTVRVSDVRHWQASVNERGA